MRAARGIPDGILSVAESRGGVGLILMGWHGQLSTQRVTGSIVKDVIRGAQCDVAVLRDRGIVDRPIRRVLVPVGSGPHARLALRLAWDIARAKGGAVTALRIVSDVEMCDLDVEMDVLRQLVEDILGDVPDEIALSLQYNETLVDGILAAAEAAEGKNTYDLVTIGASEEWFLKDLLFGSIPDRVANTADCSVLMVRKYEPAPVSWARRMIKDRQS
jgi:nucleotide-binding universal stress UspA family protein